MNCRHIKCLLVTLVFILTAGCSATDSSLIEAASKGDTEMVQALLDKGAKVNAIDKEGQTALMAAALGGHTDTVQVLLAKGADVNAKNNNGDTALMVAKKYGPRRFVRILKEAGAKE